MNSRITSKIDIEYFEKTDKDKRTPRNTGTIWLDYPVISRTIIAGAIVFVKPPENAAAPIIE